MLLGGLGYTAYAAQMLYLSDYLLYTCALLNGLGASLLWTGQGYGTQRFKSAPHFTLLLNSLILNLKSFVFFSRHEALCDQGKFISINTSASSSGRDAGVFWSLYQCSGVLGNLAVFLLFQVS